MSTETNQNETVDSKNDGGEGVQTAEEIKLAKAEYEELLGIKATVGSLKRELKDLRKSKEETQERTPDKNQTEDTQLQERVKRLELKAAGISSEKEIALAERLQKETGLDWEKLLGSKYFTAELSDLRTEMANDTAASNIRGDGSASNTKNTTAYWQAKGAPPTPDQVPDRKVRARIAREMAKSASTSGKTFYND